jgi:hypothetical protein
MMNDGEWSDDTESVDEAKSEKARNANITNERAPSPHPARRPLLNGPASTDYVVLVRRCQLLPEASVSILSSLDSDDNNTSIPLKPSGRESPDRRSLHKHGNLILQIPDHKKCFRYLLHHVAGTAKSFSLAIKRPHEAPALCRDIAGVVIPSLAQDIRPHLHIPHTTCTDCHVYGSGQHSEVNMPPGHRPGPEHLWSGGQTLVPGRHQQHSGRPGDVRRSWLPEPLSISPSHAVTTRLPPLRSPQV